MKRLPVGPLDAFWPPTCTRSSRPHQQTYWAQCNAQLHAMGPMPAGKAACAFELAALWGDTDHVKDEEWMEVGQHLKKGRLQ